MKLTAEEFFRNKIYEKYPQRSCISLAYEIITAEEAMRWAHEFKELHLYGDVRESFICHSCGTKHTGKNDDQMYEVCHGCFENI